MTQRKGKAARGSSGAWRAPWGWLAFVAAAACLPLTGNSYLLGVGIYALLFSILAMGLNIMTGFCGLLDLGYVGFYGIGAYAAAVVMNTHELSFWVALPLAAALGALWGTMLGAPTLRLTGDYFAIVTFGFSELVILITRNWTSVTKGARGFPDIHKPVLFGYEFVRFNPTAFYFLALALFSLTVFVMLRLESSRLGRAWFAIREDEIAAEACGINLRGYKTLGFAIAAAFGAMGGAFYASFSGTLHWSAFTFSESVLILCMVVMGGLGSIPGVVLGSCLLVVMQEGLRPQNLAAALAPLGVPASAIPGELRWIVYGALLILMMRWRPAGLWPQKNVAAEFAEEADTAQ
ncbi:MAG: branched-chain amino acid ABC transporter permease [Candidatus Wallbacteria bacterium]|nr:branched-chain amino acid ABC transporter permease [Candidatus Wallbacteria bacterium]